VALRPTGNSQIRSAGGFMYRVTHCNVAAPHRPARLAVLENREVSG